MKNRLLVIAAFCITLLTITTQSTTAQSWQKCTLPGAFGSSTAYYLDVFFLPSNPQFGWVCGFSGYTLRTTDGGNTWLGSVVPFNTPSDGHLESIQFLDTQNGYCSGPTGVFKSTNGGVSWTNITPTIPNGQSPWGCYFLNPNYGVFVVGGCTSHQYFYRTTDAGVNWIIYEDSVANSGLTDVILQSSGNGKAASSGRIWQTNDSGKTWSILCISGPNVWNEELSWSGNSMLIPTAGTTCNGGGGGGGARFTTDNGTTWNFFSTGTVMYGTYLLSSQIGWICGDNKSVYYTSSAGTNWELRNCGLEGSFDDLWFVNDSVGYVVGSGVYKVGPNQRTITKTSMNFGTACPPIEKYDTLWVKNKSWYSTYATYQLVGADASNYSVVYPTSSPLSINICDSIRFIVKFKPTTGGTKNASLQVTLIPDGTVFTVSLTGSLRGASSVVPNDTLIVVNNVKIGTPAVLGSVWNNSSIYTDQITSVFKMYGDDIYSLRTLPIDIPPGGVRADFSITPSDTGWTTSRYRFTISPCDRDTFITFKVYGVSPIINSVNKIQLQSKCTTIDIDSIPVTNTGNDDLKIDNVIFNPGSNDVSILRWNTNEPYPITIKRGETKYIIVRFAPTLGGTRNIRLQINNNDLTTAHGIKNPWFVNIEALSEVPVVTQSDSTIEFGEICIGSKREMTTEILNKGLIEAIIGNLQLTNQNTAFTISANGILPLTISAGQKSALSITFTPNVQGEFFDTVRIHLQPCGIIKVIPIHGMGITTSIVASPTSISTVIKTSSTKTFDVEVTSTGSADAIISNITLLPAKPEWKIASTFTLPFTLSPSKKIIVTIEITPSKDNQIFDGQLCFEVSGKCPTSLCVPVKAQSTNSKLSWNKNSLEFGVVRCSPKELLDTIIVINEGSDVDTITSATVQALTPHSFDIIAPIQFPIEVAAGNPVSIIVRSRLQREGIDTARLLITFQKMFAQQPQVFPLKSEFRKTDVTTTDTLKNFGVVETCSADQTYTVRFTNNGTLEETFTVARLTSAQEFSLNTQRVIIPPGETRSTIITFSSKNSAVGKVNEKFIWTGSVCSTSVAIDVIGEIIAPELVITPTTLPFGDVWMDTTKTLTFTITNPTPYPRDVVSFTAVDGDANAFTTNFVPQTVTNTKPVTFDVTFRPQKEGRALTHFTITERSVCQKNTTLEYSANVPNEFYSAMLQVGNNNNNGLYTVDVNDSTVVSFLLTTNDASEEALWKTNPTSITATFHYNNNIMDVRELYTIKDGKRITLPFSKTDDGIKVTIPSENVLNLGKTDTLFYAHVIGMQYVPNATDITIQRPIIVEMPKLKPYDIDVRNGVLNVASCVKWAVITSRPSFIMKVAEQPSQTTIKVQVDANTSQVINFTLVDVLGNTVLSNQEFINSNQQQVQLSAEQLASGMYLLVAINSQGIIHQIRIVVEK